VYTGNDLILMTGPPGSRWSGLARAITSNVAVNVSDEKKEFTYSKVNNNSPDLNGWHRGVYFGPYHMYGKHFDRLNLLSKEEILEEFQKPFKNWDGVKVIKSHWFAYHLPLLRKMFPEAKIVAVYNDAQKSFDHWHSVGGWNITYPHYDWYINDTVMKKQIDIENKFIVEFFDGIPSTRESIKELYLELGLPAEMHCDEVLLERDSMFKDFLKQHKNIKSLFDTIVRNRHVGVSTH